MIYGYDFMGEQETINDFIENEMHKLKEKVLEKLSSMFAHRTIVTEDFASILTYSWFDSHESAENIANQLNLCKLDFLAIQESFDAFKEEYLKYRVETIYRNKYMKDASNLLNIQWI